MTIAGNLFITSL